MTRIIDDMVTESLNRLTNRFTSGENCEGVINTEEYVSFLNKNHFFDCPLKEYDIKERSASEITEFIEGKIKQLSNKKPRNFR